VADPDPCERFLADCRTRAATDLLTHKWDPVVLSGLRVGPRRRAELLAAMGGASDKVLTESLRRLTAGGLVAAQPGGSARHVTYGLTELGTSFVDGPLIALGRWAEQRGHELTVAPSREAL
jgi:DNA-binding HxlR family transcriptional regulator